MASNKTEGVVLFAFGSRVYYYAMYNLVFTIKYYSPDVKIYGFVDSIEQLGKYCPDVIEYLDGLKEIDQDDLFTNGVFDPGKLKVNLYSYLPYDYNLYLDVDAICLKPIDPLIEELKSIKKYYASHTVGYHKLEQGRNIDSMQWAYADDLWGHFKLKEESILPAINSSLQWIEKGKESKKLYDTAKKDYEENPMPLNKLRMKWGGGQPDELYMNVALAKMQHDPSCSEIGNDGAEKGHIHFAMVRNLTFENVIKNYYFQSYYGGRGFTSYFYIDWIERMLRNMHRKNGKVHQYKINTIINNKHADKK